MPNNDTAVRIGIVGAGANTRARHIPGFQAIPGVQIVTVCNRSRESSQRVADEFGIPAVADHWYEVVSSPDVDAVMVGTWPYLHAEVSIAALSNGKHVLTEARMARTHEEAQRMLASARDHPDQVAQVVPAPMSLDADEAAIDIIQSGRLGEVREVVATSATGAGADATTPRHWRQDRQFSGQNILALGILHEIVLRWLDTDPEWIIADAEVFVKERPEPDSGEIASVEVPDSLSILGRFPSGARLMYHLSGVQAGGADNAIRINGTDACLRLDLATGGLCLTPVASQQEAAVEIPEDKRRGWRVEADFVDSIREGTPVKLTSFELGARYMQFIAAVWESWDIASRKVLVAAV